VSKMFKDQMKHLKIGDGDGEGEGDGDGDGDGSNSDPAIESSAAVAATYPDPC